MGTFKKGDTVYWQDLKGEVIDENGNYPIRVEFGKGEYYSFTSDGRYFEDFPQVLSHTPYTLNGFTQNKVIEKDTLVWVRNYEDDCWELRYYSHLEYTNHYCFVNQNTSKETNDTDYWEFLETENPLLKK